MKSLSIKQPWASLIAHGIKDIENRTWKTKFRGRIYIHASAKDLGSFFANLNPDQFKETLDKMPMVKLGNKAFFPNRPLSAIIGEVEIIDCVINHESIWADKTLIEPNMHQRKYYDENKSKYYQDLEAFKKSKPIYNWVLANSVLYDKPILNVKGKLSFWEFDPEDLKKS